MVGLGRLELPTSPLSGARSSHLSYRPSVGNPNGYCFVLLAASVCVHQCARERKPFYCITDKLIRIVGVNVVHPQAGVSHLIGLELLWYVVHVHVRVPTVPECVTATGCDAKPLANRLQHFTNNHMV